MITEKLSPDATIADWIHDFMSSTDTRFSGKTKGERRRQAIAAYYAANAQLATEETNGDWKFYPGKSFEEVEPDIAVSDEAEGLYFNEKEYLWIEKMKDGTFEIFFGNSIFSCPTFDEAVAEALRLQKEYDSEEEPVKSKYFVSGHGTTKDQYYSESFNLTEAKKKAKAKKKKKTVKKEETKISIVEIDTSAWVAANGPVMKDLNLWIFSIAPGPLSYTEKKAGVDYWVGTGKFVEVEPQAAAWAISVGASKLYLINNSIAESRAYGIGKRILGENVDRYIATRFSVLMDEKKQNVSTILKDAKKFLEDFDANLEKFDADYVFENAKEILADKTLSKSKLLDYVNAIFDEVRFKKVEESEGAPVNTAFYDLQDDANHVKSRIIWAKNDKKEISKHDAGAIHGDPRKVIEAYVAAIKFINK
jgi:hypothetical protein